MTSFKNIIKSTLKIISSVENSKAMNYSKTKFDISSLKIKDPKSGELVSFSTFMSDTRFKNYRASKTDKIVDSTSWQQLTKIFVPNTGAAKTLAGEILRAVNFIAFNYLQYDKRILDTATSYQAYDFLRNIKASYTEIKTYVNKLYSNVIHGYSDINANQKNIDSVFDNDLKTLMMSIVSTFIHNSEIFIDTKFTPKNFLSKKIDVASIRPDNYIPAPEISEDDDDDRFDTSDDDKNSFYLPEKYKFTTRKTVAGISIDKYDFENVSNAVDDEDTVVCDLYEDYCDIIEYINKIISSHNDEDSYSDGKLARLLKDYKDKLVEYLSIDSTRPELKFLDFVLNNNNEFTNENLIDFITNFEINTCKVLELNIDALSLNIDGLNLPNEQQEQIQETAQPDNFPQPAENQRVTEQSINTENERMQNRIQQEDFDIDIDLQELNKQLDSGLKTWINGKTKKFRGRSFYQLVDAFNNDEYYSVALYQIIPQYAVILYDGGVLIEAIHLLLDEFNSLIRNIDGKESLKLLSVLNSLNGIHRDQTENDIISIINAYIDDITANPNNIFFEQNT